MTIDWWTIGFQTVNVLILIWLLSRFFWRPVAAMIAQRVSITQQALDAAEAKQAEAKTALADIAKIRAGFVKEHEALLDAARKTAEQEHTARLTDATKEVAALAATGQAQVTKDASDAEKAWTERAGRLAVEIATRLLGRVDGAALASSFLERLLRELKGLKPPERQAIAPDGAPLEVVSAAPLDPAEQAKCASAVLEALQTRPKVTFKVDTSLIAGLELRAPHAVVSNSLHADLDRILLELTHDDQH